MEQSDGLDEWEDGESREPLKEGPGEGDGQIGTGWPVGRKSQDSKVQVTERLQSGPETAKVSATEDKQLPLPPCQGRHGLEPKSWLEAEPPQDLPSRRTTCLDAE